MSDPGKQHRIALKSLLKYLKGSLNVGLLFKRNEEAELHVHAYVDSNHGGCLDLKRSTSGYIFTVYGGAVSWKSSLQKMVTLSSTEAEYIAATEAVKEALWIKGFIVELSGKERKLTLQCDNQSALYLMRNPVHHERTKHTDIKYHFIREVISTGKVEAVWIESEENPADALTKPLTSAQFKYCLSLVQIVDLADLIQA